LLCAGSFILRGPVLEWWLRVAAFAIARRNAWRGVRGVRAERLARRASDTLDLWRLFTILTILVTYCHIINELPAKRGILLSLLGVFGSFIGRAAGVAKAVNDNKVAQCQLS